jgi:hypothetical protein
VHRVDNQVKIQKPNSFLINFKIYKAMWALQWQPEGRIGLHDRSKLVHPFVHAPCYTFWVKF